MSDIQGDYDSFMESLEQIKFDYTKDRVIATGDLVDRGSESLKCLSLLKEPWFHSVIGNHEMDILVYLVQPSHINQIIKNGGSWFLDAINSNTYFEVAQTIRLMMSVSIQLSK